jgi:hypothetical protein
MILGEDYRFRDEYKTDTVPIELLTGPFKGVIFRYTNVRIDENEDGTATIGFGYDALDKAGHTDTTLAKDRIFQESIGLILNQLILDITEYDANANRESDFEEPFQERIVHP